MKELKKYYVDFYDMIDGWGGYGFFEERLFDDLEEAKKMCNKLNSELKKSNRMCGEHYGVMDRDTKREVYCGMDNDYKQKIAGMIEDLVNAGDKVKIKNNNNMTEKDWKDLEEVWKDRYEDENHVENRTTCK